MRSKVAQRILDNTPKEVREFAKIYGDLLVKEGKVLDRSDTRIHDVSGPDGELKKET
jgi:hypothetical protein